MKKGLRRLRAWFSWPLIRSIPGRSSTLIPAKWIEDFKVENGPAIAAKKIEIEAVLARPDPETEVAITEAVPIQQVEARLEESLGKDKTPSNTHRGRALKNENTVVFSISFLRTCFIPFVNIIILLCLPFNNAEGPAMPCHALSKFNCYE